MNIETFSGLYFDYDDPKPEQVSIVDIAHALSNIPRFGGHVTRWYSVAEHALLVHDLLGNATQDLRLAGLHHDSHEAYLGDVPTPLKHHLPATYRMLTERADKAIAAKLNIPVERFMAPEIKRADALALRIEAAFLKKSRGVGVHWGNDGIPPEVLDIQLQYMKPADAARRFLYIHNNPRTRGL